MTTAKLSDFYPPIKFTQPPLFSSAFWGPPPPSADACVLLLAYLNRGRRRAWANCRVRLHPDGIDGMWGEIGNGGELIVVDELRLPPRHGQMWICSVVHFVALKLKRFYVTLQANRNDTKTDCMFWWTYGNGAILGFGLVPLNNHSAGAKGPDLHIARSGAEFCKEIPRVSHQ